MMKELTKKEIEEKGKELAERCIALEQLQLKNKDKRKKLKEAEVSIESEISALALQVETGKIEVADQVDAFEDTKSSKRKLSAVEDDEEPEEKH